MTVIPPGHFTTIAVGIDGSPSAINALAWARRLAGQTGAAITAVSAWDYPTLETDPQLGPLLPPAEHFEAQAEARIETAIRRTASESQEEGAEDTTNTGDTGEQEIISMVLKASARDALVASSGHADLLVVGRKGVSRLTRLLVGSTTSWVVRHTEGAVAVVPSRYQVGKTSVETGVGMRVLVGCDGTEHANQALRWAASHLPGEVTAAFIFDPSRIGDFGPNHEYLDTLREVEVRRLETSVASIETEAEVVAASTRINRLFVEGTPADALLDLAADYDVVVLGAGSREGFPRLLLGSVADYVTQHADLPIIIVRRTECGGTG